MPNVAGREFPYTPQGMAAAEQYRQSLGMRGGGMMGFRPLGYQEGGGVPEGGVPIGTGETRMGGFNAPDVQTLVNDLVSVMRDGTEQDVRNFVNSNRYLLEGVANMDIPQARIVRSVLLGNPAPQPTQEQQLMKQLGTPDTSDPSVFMRGDQQRMLGSGVMENPGYDPQTGDFFPPVQQGGHGGGEVLAPPRMGEYQMYDAPAAPMHSKNADDAYYGGGFPGPSFIPSEGQTAPDFRAHGGYVGRGTSAGELAPRGSMSVREAGETMYELAKRRRGMRGGGIMSLRR